MRKILAIIKREYKEAVYKKSFIILTLLMPALMIGFSVLPALLMQIKSQKQTRIHVIDLSHKIYAPLQKNLSGDTLKTGEPRYVFTAIEVAPNAVEATLQAEKKLIAAKKIDVLLYVPADIDSSLQVKFYARNVADLDLTSRFKNEISSIISRERLIAAGIQPELVERLTRRVKLATFKITKGGKESKSGFVQEYFGTFIFIFFLYFTIIMYGACIMRSIIQEEKFTYCGNHSFRKQCLPIYGRENSRSGRGKLNPISHLDSFRIRLTFCRLALFPHFQTIHAA